VTSTAGRAEDAPPLRHRRPPWWTIAIFVVLLAVVAAAVVVWYERRSSEQVVYLSSTGDDEADGRSPEQAWRTLAKISRTRLAPGSVIRIARGSTFTGQLDLPASGTEARPITVQSYGDGALPVVSRGESCVVVTGSWVVVSQLAVDDCGYAGVLVQGDHVTVTGVTATGSVAGVAVDPGSEFATVTGNEIADNTKMSVLTREPTTDDAGAFGVALQGRNAVVSNNRISGHHAFSYDFGEDGAGVEVFNSVGNVIHNNLIFDSSGIELGGDSADNYFSYNLVSSTRPTSQGVLTRGASDEFGPVQNTTVANVTLWLTGARSQGLVCYGGCTTELLTVRNTIVVADQAVYVDGPFTDQSNLFSGTVQGTVASRVLSVADLGLTDPAGGNFVPTADSPAVDAGTEVDQPTTPVDAAGNPVTGRPDIGAYERP
jgi:hypothetical protein